MLRPEGLLGPLLLRGRGHDLRGTTAAPVEVARGEVEVEVAFLDGRRLVAVRADPPAPGLDALVGVSASSGFRQRLDDIVDGPQPGSVVYQLLDDVPVATLVSGYALGAAGIQPVAPRAGHRWTPDLCSGWRTGGSIMVEIEAFGRPPVVTGPTAPVPGSTTQPDLGGPDLPPQGMRRARRTDVRWDGDRVVVTSWFRDSHASEEGRTTVIHEYDVDVEVDPASWQVLSAHAVARVLPWTECPAAAASAGWLVGRALPGLRSEVRRDFTGTSTCTHLNDQLRSLADVPLLVAQACR